MAEPSNGLTLEGLAQILRDHMDGTAARFAEAANQLAEERAERRAQDARWRASIQDLRGEIGTVAALVRDLGQIVLRQVDQIEEHRQQIRQIFSRMEQHDARFEAVTRDIRRILDAIERRPGNGGRRRRTTDD